MKFGWNLESTERRTNGVACLNAVDTWRRWADFRTHPYICCPKAVSFASQEGIYLLIEMLSFAVVAPFCAAWYHVVNIGRLHDGMLSIWVGSRFALRVRS